MGVFAAVPGAFGEDARACLSEGEKARAERFRRPCDRRLFETAHALLRFGLSLRVGGDPAGFEFGTTPLGKPFPVNRDCEDLEVSLTLTFGIAACAVRRFRPVGVDAEALRTLDDLEALARSTLAPHDRRRVQAAATLARKPTSADRSRRR